MLLLDEPLGALDLKLRKGLQVELKKIQREVGITFVYVTHDQEEALTMSDRIAVMNQGRIEQIGDPEEVYDRPTTTFVAGFIGVSNLMPGDSAQDRRTGRGRARQRRACEHGRQWLPPGRSLPRRGAPREARDRTRGIVGSPSVEGLVESSLYLGTSTQLIVQLAGEVRMTVLVPNADEAERQRLPGGGAKVKLSWAPEHIHVVRESDTKDAVRPRGSPKQLEQPNEEGAVGSKTRFRALVTASGALATAVVLAACGGGGDNVGGGNSGDITVAKGGTASGSVLISNWPGYVDPKSTIADFDQQTGLNTTYKEDVNDNNTFFNKLKPQLDQGSSGGRSLFVVTDWMAKRMYDLGYLQQIDHATLPTVFQNILPQFEKSTSRPWPQVLDSLAGRPDRHLGRHVQGTGDPFGRRPVRPEVQGQGHDADRDDGHGPTRPAERGDQCGRRDQGRLAGGDRQAPRGA